MKKYHKIIVDLITIIIPILLSLCEIELFYLSLYFILIPFYYLLKPYFLPIFIISSLLTLNAYAFIIIGFSTLIAYLLSITTKKKAIVFLSFILFSSFNLLYEFFYYSNINYLKQIILFCLSFIIFLGLINSLSFDKQIRIKNTNFFYCLIMSVLTISTYNSSYSSVIIVLAIIILSLLNKEHGLLLGIFSTFLTNNIAYAIFSLLPFIPFFMYVGISIITLDFFLINYLNVNDNIIFLLGVFLISLLYHYKDTKDEKIQIYDDVLFSFNESILNYASFLDEFDYEFVSNYQEQLKVDKAFFEVTNNFCQNCHKKNICFKEKKHETFGFIKEAIYYGKDIYLKGNFPSNKDFMRFCDKYKEIINRLNCFRMENKINSKKEQTNKLVSAQIRGISNVIKQFSTDLSSKKEINLYSLINFKQYIKNLGYNLILFEIKSFAITDLWIELGIMNISESEIHEVVKKALESEIKQELTVVIKDKKDHTCFVSLVSKINYLAEWGASSLAKGNENIKGDNYLIKKTENGKLIVALSDGMGSGINAYKESKMTLSLIDKISKLETCTSTNINMLNTFYQMKDEFENYSTLDLLSINLTNGNGILYKMGSSTTYILRKSEVIKVENENLPFGINDEISKQEITIEDEDIIILLSDGVNDYLDYTVLASLFPKMPFNHPQKSAFEILKKTINQDEIKDDTTAIVVKFKKIG